MSLKKEILDRLKQYMREKKSEELACVRQIKSEIMKFETSVSKDAEASDEDVMKILNSLAKQHKESIDIYSKNDRKDLLDKEQLELDVIESFLPSKLTGEDLQALVNNVIESTGAQSKKDMGAVMKAARDEIQNKGLSVDGQELAGLVKTKLP